MLSRVIVISFLCGISLFAQNQYVNNYNPSLGSEKYLGYWKYNAVDNIDWADSKINDSDWISVKINEFYIEKKGIHWLRTKINFITEVKGYPVVLKLGRIQSAFEVYWNGTLVGKNGKVGITEVEEEPGLISFALSLDTLAKKGENILSVRFSNFHQMPPGIFFYSKLESNLNTNILSINAFLRTIFTAAIAFAGAIFGLSLFLSGKQYKNYLYYFLFSVSFFISLSLLLLVRFMNISLNYFPIFEPVFLAGLYMAEISIFLFALFSFDVPYKRSLIIAIILVSVVFYVCNLNYKTLFLLNYETYKYLMFPVTLILFIYSFIKKKPGSYIALFGFILYSTNLISGDFIGIKQSFRVDAVRSVFILTYVLVANRHVNHQLQLQKSAELRSKILENELLKKSIQPHFIMNTLFSIKSWIKSDKDKADRLIEAVANEFRVINRIFSKKEITIKEELELCRYHLELMGYRKDATYKLIKNNIKESELIPPLVFHTLIENGITHAYEPMESGTFWITYTEEGNVKKYVLENDGSLLAEIPGNKIEESTGIQYVKARLEENYPGRWKMYYGLSGKNWNSTIIISSGNNL